MWSGSGLDRSASESGSAQKWTHMFVYVAAWMQHDKKKTTRCAAASVQFGRLAGWSYNLQQCQLDNLTAWMCNSCSLAAGLLSSVTLRQVQLGSVTAWQRGFTTVCCLAASQGE